MELHMKYIWLKSLLARKSNRAKSTNRPRNVKPAVEHLEQRCLMDVRSITGFGNNIANPNWGKSGIDLLRQSPVAYADHISTPSAPNTLSPRQISNDLSNQSNPIFSFKDNLGNNNQAELSDYSYAFGQFIDHDMDLTLDNSGQAFNIPADPTRPNDPMGAEPFTRSQFDPHTGTTNPRQQINQDTAFLDLSQTYGSTDRVSSLLRTHVGGLLKTSANDFLPRESDFTAAQLAIINQDEGGIANDAMQVLDSQLFVAGDKRVNENVELMSQQTLFMRNHNRLAGQIHAAFPTWTDEQIFQEARKLNIAEYQNIVYNGYLPSILGTGAVPAYAGYNPNVNPGIRTEFSTVGFRFGHSILSSTVGRDNNDGTGITDVNPNGSPINLTEDFFRPDLINNNHVTVNLVDRFGNPDPHTSSTVGEVLKALSDGLPNEFDLRLIDEIRNILFGIPHGPGTDLAARDIQRTRDHGIGTYNQVRVAYGLAPVTAFNQISSDPAIQAALQNEYGAVTKIDPFIGMLAEDIIPGSDVGPTCRAILVHQFRALRDGDRFYFQNETFNAFEQSLLAQGDNYADVIKNNTSITNLQEDVFFNRLEISGTVFNDPDGNGVRESGEPGIQGVTVELRDPAAPPSAPPIASVVTDVNGEYDFTEKDGTIPATGNYVLKLILPSGFTQNATQVAHNPGVQHLSRGDLQLDGRDFAIRSTGPGAPQGGGGSGSEEVELSSASSTDAVGPVTHFGISAVEQPTIGSPMRFTIVALDATDHVVTGYTGTLHFTSTDGGATLPIDYTFTSDDLGSHLFSVTFATADDQTLTAMDVSSDNFVIGGVQFTVL
jgi:peroxidase